MRLLSALLITLALLSSFAHAADAILRRVGPDCTLLLNEKPVLTFGFPRMMGMPPEIFDAADVGDGWTHVTIGWKVPYTQVQDDLAVDFTVAIMPDFWWAPHLAPQPGDCIAQHAFRSPALIAADATTAIALVPDLALAGQSPDAPWYLDVDAPAKRWSLGIARTEVTEHVRFRKVGGARFAPGDVKISFYLNAYALDGTARDPFAKVASFLWQKHGSPLLAQGQPLTVPLDRYVEHTYAWAFDRWRKPVWQEFKQNGQPMGAPAFIVNVTQSPNHPGDENLREFLSIWNQAWFSSLRSASGLFRYAKQTNNAELLNRAKLGKELALAAPMKDGIFPSVFRTEMETIEKNGQPLNRSKGWETGYWTNSNRVPWNFGVTDAWYHVLDASWTTFQMLRWHQELEQDPRLLEYVRTYADKLLDLQYDDGFFPAWLHPDTQEPVRLLLESPETSMSAWMLFELAEATGKRKYRKAATHAIDGVIRDVITQGRWEDFETYWSCNSYGQKDLLGKRDERSGMFKQCNFGMYWTAGALLAAHHATKKAEYLAWGERVLNELSMTQQVWQPPYVQIPALGGFGVMNFDGEWNDARQSLYAELFLDYYRATGKRAYFERGIAALKASFVMMYCPENAQVKALWEKAWPFFGPEDYGFMMENYAHGGSMRPEDNPMGEFTIYDWGNGAAAEARNRVRDHYGDVYIDTTRGTGFGIDSVAVEGSAGSYRLKDLAKTPRKVLVVESGGARRWVELNGEVAYP